MRRALLVVSSFLALVITSPARAGELRLWACHGPDGTPVATAYNAAGTFGTVFTDSAGNGCYVAGGAMRLAFTNPDPQNGMNTWVQFAVPPDLTLSRVRLDRTAAGPGYVARTSSAELERADTAASLDSVVTKDAAGDFVELRLSCVTASASCDAPNAGVSLRSVALTVRDDAPPVITVPDIRSPAIGTIAFLVQGQDAGIGLATATVTVDGQLANSALFDGTRCHDLSPFDGTIDLPLGVLCAPRGTAALRFDTSAYPDGAHRLVVTVTDGAGNTTSSTDDVVVRNHFDPVPIPVATAVPTPTPVAAARTLATRDLVRLPAKLKLSRRGQLTLSALCPATATAPCRITLRLTRGRTLLASGRGTAAPGRRARIVLTLAKRHRRAGAAQLTYVGATPMTVRLRQGVR